MLQTGDILDQVSHLASVRCSVLTLALKLVILQMMRKAGLQVRQCRFKSGLDF